MSDFAPVVSTPVADKDVARTFAESGLSLSHDATQVASESVGLVSGDGSTTTATRPNNASGTFQRSAKFGLKIDTGDVYSESITITMDGDTQANTVYLLDADDNVIESLPAPGPNGTAEFTAGFSGVGYVVADSGGSDFTVAWYGSPSFPYSSGNVDIIAGRDGTGDRSNLAPAITDVQVRSDDAASGKCYVSWSLPDDVYAWDTAVYTRSLAGETVDLYVEEDQAGGWTEVAGPIQRGDAIPADPSNDVRFRVELSRSDTSNNPTLDSLARRWKL